MEKLYYEIRPWLYVGLAMFALIHASESSLMGASGGLLLACGGLIIFTRFRRRGLL